MRLCRLLLSFILAITLGACVSTRVTPGHLFQPRPCSDAELGWPASVGDYRLELWTLKPEPETAVEAVALRHPSPRAVLLYFGGNSLRHCPQGLEFDPQVRTAVERYSQLGLSVVFMNYRGYGGSTGRAGFESVKRDAVLLHDRVRADSDLAGLPLIVHGQSMGTLFAGYVAIKRPVAAAILESPPTTIDDVVKAAVPWYARPFVRVDADAEVRAQDNAAISGAVEVPVLYIVGDRDRVTPPAMARRLHEASPARDKALVVVRGGQHGNLVDFSAFWEALATLVDQITSPQIAARYSAARPSG